MLTEKIFVAHFNPVQTSKPSESWQFAVTGVIVGWFLYVALNVYIEREFSDRNWSTYGLLLEFSAMYFVMLAVALVISFLVGKGVKKYRSIPNVDLVMKAFWVSAAFLALLTYGAYEATIGSRGAINNQRQKSPANTEPDQIAEVTAAITIISIEEYGEVEANFDGQAMAAIEEWLLDTAIEKLKVQFAESGIYESDYDNLVKATSSVVRLGGQDLAFFKLNVDDTARMVAIFGIENGDWVKVSCIRNSNHDVTVFSGPCGEKLFEAFGVQIQP